MTDLVIYSVGPFARLMHYYFSHDSQYRVVAFTADSEFLQESTFCGLPAIAFERVAREYPPSQVRMFVAIGYRRMRSRSELFQRAKAQGYEFANYVSRHAICFPDLELGGNNALLPDVIIEPFAKLGDNNLLFSGALIGHDVKIGNGSFFSARSMVAGNSIVGDGCFFGASSTVINGITIADETHILPGSVIYSDTRRCGKYRGCPARQISTHEEHGIVIERG